MKKKWVKFSQFTILINLKCNGVAINKEVIDFELLQPIVLPQYPEILFCFSINFYNNVYISNADIIVEPDDDHGELNAWAKVWPD